MMKRVFALVLPCCLAQVVWADDLSAASRYLIEQIQQGGPVSIRQAAQTIERSGERDVRVLDTLAEALLQNYKISNNTNIDAMAWACKGLASSGNKRYYSAIKEVSESEEARKLRKHCSRAADDLGSAEGEQYALGMASLKAAPVSTETKVAAENKTNATASNKATESATESGKAPITEVRAGMSMEQAYAVAGHPTSTTSYETGKRWVPFNFKGGDVQRTAALYKGQGRIVFSNNSAYSSGMSVVEVIVDTSEKGYP